MLISTQVEGATLVNRLLTLITVTCMLFIWLKIFPAYDQYVVWGVALNLVRLAFSRELFAVFSRKDIEKLILESDDNELVEQYTDLIKFVTKEFVLRFIQVISFLIILAQISTIAYVWSPHLG